MVADDLHGTEGAVLIDARGTAMIVLLLAGTSLLGAFVTWAFRVETTGLSPDEADRMHDAPSRIRAGHGLQPDSTRMS